MPLFCKKPLGPPLHVTGGKACTPLDSAVRTTRSTVWDTLPSAVGGGKAWSAQGLLPQHLDPAFRDAWEALVSEWCALQAVAWPQRSTCLVSSTLSCPLFYQGCSNTPSSAVGWCAMWSLMSTLLGSPAVFTFHVDSSLSCGENGFCSAQLIILTLGVWRNKGVQRNEAMRGRRVTGHSNQWGRHLRAGQDHCPRGVPSDEVDMSASCATETASPPTPDAQKHCFLSNFTGSFTMEIIT